MEYTVVVCSHIQVVLLGGVLYTIAIEWLFIQGCSPGYSPEVAYTQ